ncbi:MAG: hypothetical protein K5931_05490 [Lachnospiraceae bacterium]|nr:hypothetical protein [Lachnospiraceae bacterium]
MDKICDYCNAQYDDSLDNCPHCGAPNNSVRRGKGVPRTIEELKNWYKDHNLPDEEVTRFFIGRDYKEPKAFGIYKDQNSGDFIVYKNKANGQRAVRYQGKDESYAVNELYQKLKDEIARQKANQAGRGRKRSSSDDGNYIRRVKIMRALVTVAVIIFVAFLCIPANKNGYYNIDGDTYYCRDDKWYAYDRALDDWYYYGSIPLEKGDDYSNYYEGYSNNDSSIDTDFTDSAFYEDNFSSDDDSDWDSDSDWSSDYSWDSGGSDWDSDW